MGVVIAGPHPNYGGVVPRAPLVKLFRNHYWGRGLTIVISAAKIGRGWKIPKNTGWVFQGLLPDIVGSELGFLKTKRIESNRECRR